MDVAELSRPHRGRAGAVRRRSASCCSRSTISLVDLIYFGRRDVARGGRLQPLPARLRRASSSAAGKPGLIAIFIPAWDESGGHRVDAARHARAASTIPITGSSSAITATTRRPRRRSPASPTRASRRSRSRPTARRPRPTASTISTTRCSPTRPAAARSAKAVVLHDAEDVVHPLELRLFDRLIDRAGDRPAAGASAARPGSRMDRGPLLRRVRRGARQGAGGARGGRRVDPARRGRLRDRARAARPPGRARRTAGRSPATA